MNRYKAGGPSKASATTQCQKCLQRGHYSYECTAKQSDRPYISRPSRTQQLANPKLAPKITEATPPKQESKKKPDPADGSSTLKRKLDSPGEPSRKRSHHQDLGRALARRPEESDQAPHIHGEVLHQRSGNGAHLVLGARILNDGIADGREVPHEEHRGEIARDRGRRLGAGEAMMRRGLGQGERVLRHLLESAV